MRQAAEEGFAEQRKTRQGHLQLRRMRQLLRDSMRSKLVKALREKVALSNRAEALQSIVPQVQGKKGSSKTSKPSATSRPSIKDKPSAKNKLSKHLKPSAKIKPSLSKKAEKKQARKAAADKALKPTKKGLPKPKDTTEGPPPLPPPSLLLFSSRRKLW